jgi:hypothetical protein
MAAEMTVSEQDLHNRFDFHPPGSDEIVARHALIRGECLSLAATIVDQTPYSREQSLALTAIEEAMMWANAAIARHQTE